MTPKRTKPYPRFAAAAVTGAQIAAAAQHYVGAAYQHGAAFEDADTGAANCDCAGLALLVWRRVGLLLPGVDLSLPYATHGAERPAVLMAMLRANYKRTSQPQIGDLLIGAGNRHVSILTSEAGHICAAQESVGRVVERLFGVEDEPFQAWTLKRGGK